MDPIPERFIHGSRMYCPWCSDWDAFQAFIALQTPPGHEDHCPPIFKHGGADGCKRLFSIYEPILTVVEQNGHVSVEVAT